jgi:hypothetical protein
MSMWNLIAQNWNAETAPWLIWCQTDDYDNKKVLVLIIFIFIDQLFITFEHKKMVSS